MTSRGPLTLAALASAAVPGLDPDSVEGVVTPAVSPFDVAFVQDHEHRRWVVRSPRTPAASAQLEQSAALLALLARRLTMPVPAVRGWAALPEGGRACVTSYLTGRLVDLESIAPGSRLAAGLGRALAQLHNLDTRVYEEAGVPVYDAASYRTRRLAELDRAAATGRVPTGLLARWEGILDDASLWGFVATPTHGAIGPGTVLATPDDGEEPDVKGLLGWESAQVADPADDLAPLVGELLPEALDTVLEAYAHARVERPDQHLQRRARLVHEMQLVRSMMVAVAAGDDTGAEQRAAELRRLDKQLAAEETAEQSRLPEPKGEAPAADEAPDETSDDAPDAKAGTTTTQPVATAAAAQAAESDEDQAVEVEPTGPAQPVKAEASDAVDEPSDDGEAPAAAADAEDDVTDANLDTEATTDAAADADTGQDAGEATDAAAEAPAEAGAPSEAGEPEEVPVAVPRQGNDHETAEIVPINDEDDGDDIIPVLPRR
ncbi:phosphotransferase [Janibacter sp. FSL W8-0316]|uniref:phosphotransferase n=1 Tax=Janibacter TaxID=53457 RepID=UPI0030FA561F